MQHTHLGPRADALAQSITDELLKDPSIPTAIMAGHEVLSVGGGVTVIFEGREYVTTQGSIFDRTYSDVFGEFPDVSRNIGKAIIERTRDHLSSIHLFALINDWYELRHKSPLGSNTGEEEGRVHRDIYWSSPFNGFSVEKDQKWMGYLLPGLSGQRDCGRPIAHPLGRVSEYALQQSFRKVYGERSFGHLSEDCNLCSSEIVMMVSMLYRQGIRRLVSFVPNVCTRAVNAGSVLLEKGEFQNDELRFDEPFEMTNVYLNAVNAWSEDDVVLPGAMPPIRHVLRS